MLRNCQSHASHLPTHLKEFAVGAPEVLEASHGIGTKKPCSLAQSDAFRKARPIPGAGCRERLDPVPRQQIYGYIYLKICKRISF